MLKIVTALALGVSCLAAAAEYKTEQREPVHHVFARDSTLDVDNVNGWISVIGDNEASIRVDGEKIVRGADQSEVDRGKREVVLDINEKDGVAQLYVNGPFRDNGHASQDHGFHEHSDRHYEVIYNLTIHAPRATVLNLRSVNGEVKAGDTAGAFDIHAVNGAVTMTNIAGSGKVNTVNGPVQIGFRENPRAESSFKTVNGRIDVTLQPNLSADMKVKTFNGHVYTDFDVTALASPAGTAERADGKFVYRSNRFQSFRAGSGGPELAFETLNGDIHIAKKGK
ncbi:MAG: hypothetical protein M3N54_16355 [Acidobacteriota bacterium]|nr:hypothetical protein [Acidobacteriota bacterium]